MEHIIAIPTHVNKSSTSWESIWQEFECTTCGRSDPGCPLWRESFLRYDLQPVWRVPLAHICPAWSDLIVHVLYLRFVNQFVGDITTLTRFARYCYSIVTGNSVSENLVIFGFSTDRKQAFVPRIWLWNTYTHSHRLVDICIPTLREGIMCNMTHHDVLLYRFPTLDQIKSFYQSRGRAASDHVVLSLI